MLENKINSIKKYIGGAVIGLSLAVVPVAYEPAMQFVSKEAQSQNEVYNGFDGRDVKMGFDKVEQNKGFDGKVYNGFDGQEMKMGFDGKEIYSGFDGQEMKMGFDGKPIYNGFDWQEIKMGFDKVDPNKGFDVYQK